MNAKVILPYKCLRGAMRKPMRLNWTEIFPKAQKFSTFYFHKLPAFWLSLSGPASQTWVIEPNWDVSWTSSSIVITLSIATPMCYCLPFFVVHKKFCSTAIGRNLGQPKPPAFQPCQVQQCPINEDSEEASPVRERSLSASRDFKWDYGEWTACSASCLGGLLAMIEVGNKLIYRISQKFNDQKINR